MVSILIPVYNYNVALLIRALHEQLVLQKIIFEIRVYDDCSTQWYEDNTTLDQVSNCILKILPKNIGRSRIRNLLAYDAQYPNLLFIDAGTFPSHKNFIADYLRQIEKKVVVGGMTCLKERPQKPYLLRWLYTKERESLIPQNTGISTVICSSNFMIKKDIFERIQFDESLHQYGCEDVLFFDAIAKDGIVIHYLQNPVIHAADDSATTFIHKTELAIQNLIQLINDQKIRKDRYRVSKLFYKLHVFKLDFIIAKTFRLSKNMLVKNFNSDNPSIFYYDLYRLGYFCYLKQKK